MAETPDIAKEPADRTPGSWIGRWSALTPAGKRRIGEFIANIPLGAAAAIMTLIVIPAFVGRAAVDGWGIVVGVVISAIFAILAVIARLFTEERIGDGP